MFNCYTNVNSYKTKYLRFEFLSTNIEINEDYCPRNLPAKNHFNIKIVLYNFFRWTHRFFVKDYRATSKLYFTFFGI